MKTKEEIIAFLDDPNLYNTIIETAREKQYFDLNEDEILAGGCPSIIITNILFNCNLDYHDIDIFKKFTKEKLEIVNDLKQKKQALTVFKKLLTHFNSDIFFTHHYKKDRSAFYNYHHNEGHKAHFLEYNDICGYGIPYIYNKDTTRNLSNAEVKNCLKCYEKFEKDKKIFNEMFKDVEIKDNKVCFERFFENKEFVKDYLSFFINDLYMTDADEGIRLHFYSTVNGLLNTVYYHNLDKRSLFESFDINAVKVGLQNGKVIYTKEFIDFLLTKELKICKFSTIKTILRLYKKYETFSKSKTVNFTMSLDNVKDNELWPFKSILLTDQEVYLYNKYIKDKCGCELVLQTNEEEFDKLSLYIEYHRDHPKKIYKSVEINIKNLVKL